MEQTNNRRRRFLKTSVVVAAGGVAASFAGAAPAGRPASTRAAGGLPSLDESAYDWTDVSEWAVGRAFTADTVGDYDRLPARAKDVVRAPVWDLSRDSAGVSVDFTAETPEVAVRYTLNKPNVAMAHMPATGVSGVDLYGLDGERWRWLGVTRPAAQQVSQVLVKELRPASRRYRLYLPLYNGVRVLEVGLPKGNGSFRGSKWGGKPVVYYGTSIAQGGCASRPGMAFTSILSRRLDRLFVNLAFSGNGKMEENVGRFLCEIDPAAYVIDCLPNMTPAEVKERTEPLVSQLRKARPGVPIVLVEDRTHDTAWACDGVAKLHVERRGNLREAYDRMVAAGVEKLTYVPGASLLGSDGEATVDGSHPTDLGMVRYADALEPVLKKVLS